MIKENQEISCPNGNDRLNNLDREHSWQRSPWWAVSWLARRQTASSGSKRMRIVFLLYINAHPPPKKNVFTHVAPMMLWPSWPYGRLFDVAWWAALSVCGRRRRSVFTIKWRNGFWQSCKKSFGTPEKHQSDPRLIGWRDTAGVFTQKGPVCLAQQSPNQIPHFSLSLSMPRDFVYIFRFARTSQAILGNWTGSTVAGRHHRWLLAVMRIKEKGDV